MHRRLMPPEETTRLLREILQRANARGLRGNIRVVGGAAIAIMDPHRRTTSDIDAVLLPPGAFDDIVSELAAEHELQEGWLNDSAKAFIPMADLTDWVMVEQQGDVALFIGRPEMLLAMKLYANRASRDWDDIHFLLEACDIRSVEQAQEIYERYHAQDVIADSAVTRLHAWLAAQGLE